MISWPLLDLFYYLRERDLPLGIGEYMLLLRALEAGYGKNQEGLFRLCLRLWAKNQEDKRHIDEYFRQYPEEVNSFSVNAVSREVLLGEVGKIELSTIDSEAAEIAESAAVSFGITEGEVDEFKSEQDALEFAQPGGGMIAIRTRRVGSSLRSRFILSGEYFPISQRQMKQHWRYIRRMQRRGAPSELDIPATVQKVSREGLLYEPVMLPPRTNTAELLLLVDRDGSMAPFHELGDQLIQTAAGAGRLGRFAAYYFHNFPPYEAGPPEDEYFFFRLPSLAFDEPLRDILMKFNQDDTSILIFSDGGAARGGRSLERISKTVRFLAYLKRLKIHSLAWLNPMPASRWAGTSAEAVQRIVAMFELSRSGMAALIDALRGSGK